MAVGTLNSTKYPNNQSVVSGTYTVFKDDVTILCDTSTAPVTINLLQIPSNGGYTKQGNWSTQYKLYVVDFAQNANVNNITVVAPTGFKINATSSQTITTNGGSLMIRVVSNLDYLASGALSIGANIPYFSAQKNLYALGTVYFPQNTNPSITLGASASAYDGKVETGVLTGSFNLLTGIWTVPATGIYNISVRINTQINKVANTVTDLAGNYWMTTPAPSGVFSLSSIGKITVAIKNPNPLFGLISSNSIMVTQATSDVIITATLNSFPANIGDQYQVVVLNQTNHDIVGCGQVPTFSGTPLIVFTGQKIA